MARKRTWLYIMAAFAIFVICDVGSADVAPLDTDPNLVGWWKFDEVSGQTAEDASPHNRDGTLLGDLSFDKDSVPGKIGRGLSFTRSDGTVQVRRYKGVSGTGPRTIAVWIKTTLARGEIVSWGTEDFGKMWTFGHIRGRIGVTPHGGYLYINDATNDDTWHHVASTTREAEAPNLYDDVTLYLDGKVATIHDIGLLDLWPIDTGDTLDVRIGRQFKGCLDDLRIYDRQLSEEEIGALFKAALKKPATDTDTPSPSQTQAQGERDE